MARLSTLNSEHTFVKYSEVAQGEFYCEILLDLEKVNYCFSKKAGQCVIYLSHNSTIGARLSAPLNLPFPGCNYAGSKLRYSHTARGFKVCN